MFDRTAFYAAFDGKLNALASAEKITKDTLRDLSRDLLFVLFETEDVSFINRTVEVLTPVNKKVAVLFFKEHAGFKLEHGTNKFLSKDKKVYDKVKEKVLALLADPHFNIWTWAEKNVDVEVKPLDMTKITTWMKSTLKKAEEQNISKTAIFNAIMAGGFTADELLEIMAQAAE